MSDTKINPPIFVTSQPLVLKQIPHKSAKTVIELPASQQVALVGAEPKRGWFNVHSLVKKEVRGGGEQYLPLYGWASIQGVRTLDPTTTSVPLEKIPATHYEHNSRQDILNLIKAIKYQASHDFRASGRRGLAARWVFFLIYPVLILGSLVFATSSFAEALIIASVIASFIWLLWVAVIWSDYNPGRDVARLDKVQKAKRNPVEVLEDQIKTGTKIAAGIGFFVILADIFYPSKGTGKK